jgi:hypothetical protein
MLSDDNQSLSCKILHSKFFHLKKISNSYNKTFKKDEKEEVLKRDAFRIYFVSFIQQGGEK